MKITIFFTGHLDLKGIRDGQQLILEPDLTVADLLTGCNIRQEHQRFIIPIVNGQERRLSYQLKENDELRLFLPVGGG
jgi:sulfur carrier protein ThiS